LASVEAAAGRPGQARPERRGPPPPRLPEMERLGHFLFKHLEGIAAYCDHPVRFGVVESINTTIKAVLRRARGIRDGQILRLKLKWATAHPIRSARDLARFLTAQPLYSIGEDRRFTTFFERY
jgi:hypothetical protein